MSATLYYTPSSCGASSFIAAHKAGLIGTKIKAIEVDIRAHVVLSTGEDFYKINPRGNVPCLVLADGTVLNENAACLLAIGDMNPASGLVPTHGSSARYLVNNKLSLVGTELHKGVFAALFNPASSEDVKANSHATAKKALKVILVDSRRRSMTLTWLVERSFSWAMRSLLLILTATSFSDGLVSPCSFDLILAYVAVDLTPYPNVVAYHTHIGSLDFVKESHAAMAKASEKK